MTWLQRLRIFLGLDTEADRRARHAHMLRLIQDELNELDRRELVDERTPVERRRRRTK